MPTDATSLARRDEPAPLATGVAIERRIRDALVNNLARLAQDCSASAVFIYADALDSHEVELLPELEPRLFFITKTRRQEEEHESEGHRIVRVPNVTLSRFGQVQIAVLLALSRKLITPDDVVIFLIGAPGSGAVDTLLVLHVRSEFETLLDERTESDLTRDVRPDVLERVVNLAAELGDEGREGKPVGALFVVGDSERVLSFSRQLILNPFKGYPDEDRNILAPELRETVKELSSIDGAFVIRGDGVIESAGTYLAAAVQADFELPPGLGARHQAAAGITSATNAVAVAVSESTGTVTVFRRGQMIADLERPRSRVERREPE